MNPITFTVTADDGRAPFHARLIAGGSSTTVLTDGTKVTIERPATMWCLEWVDQCGDRLSVLSSNRDRLVKRHKELRENRRVKVVEPIRLVCSENP
jgi:hypothetical protein